MARRIKHARRKLQSCVAEHRARRQRTRVDQVVKNIRSLASKGAWTQISRVMDSTVDSHTAAEQTNWEGSGVDQARHAFLQGRYAELLGDQGRGEVPEALEDLAREGAPFDLRGEYGGAKTRKVEGQYPHVSWKKDDWGDNLGPHYMRKAALRLKSGAAAGPDGMAPELFRWVDSNRIASLRGQVPDGALPWSGDKSTPFHWQHIGGLLSKMVEAFFDAGFTPREWRLARTVLVHKSGDKTQWQNYRPISVGSAVAKLAHHAILYKLEAYCERRGVISNAQRGFRSGMSTEDAIASLLSFVQDKRAAGPGRLRGRSAHACFVDFSKAYDSIPREWLWAKLSALGFGDTAVSFFRSTFKDYQIRIAAADGLTEPIVMHGGLPQGHVLSPFLFNLYLDDLLRHLEMGDHADVGGTSSRVLAYADDVVILCENAVDLQARLDKLKHWSDTWGMTVNLAAGKTEYLRFGPPGVSPVLTLGGQRVKETSEYKYLGVLVGSADRGLKFDKMKKRMLGVARHAHHVVKVLMAAAPDLPAAIVAQIWQSWVLPKLMYGIGVWFKGDSWPEADRFMGRSASSILQAPLTSPYGALLADLGWRSTAFWISYHRCRAMTKMIRAPNEDTALTSLQEQVRAWRRDKDASWIGAICKHMADSRCQAGSHVHIYLRSRLQVAIAEDSVETRVNEMDSMDFEALWADACLQLEFNSWADIMSGNQEGSNRRWFLSIAELRSKAAHRRDVKGQWKRLRSPAPVYSARLPKSVVASLVAARSGADPRARMHPQNKHRVSIGERCSCCDSDAKLTVEHALSCPTAWQHPVVEEAVGSLLDLIPSLKLGHALVPPVVASAENVDALRAWIVQCGLVPLRALVGRVGKGTVPLHLEHVYSRLRSCAASWSAWIRGMYQIIEALWTVHELSADIAVAAMQVPGGEGGDPSSSDAPSDSEDSELSEASSSEESEGDLPPPGDPPDQPVAGGRGAEPPPAHEAVVLMGLGDLIGRGALGGPGGVSSGSEGHDEGAQGGGGLPPEGRGGSPGDQGGGITDEDEDCGEDNHAQQGLAASDGGRLEHRQQGLGVNAGEGGDGGGRAVSLQDLRAPSLLGSLWDLVGSLG